MSRPRQLAEVERIVARIGADQDLPETQRLAAQRDTWRDQAYATGARIRQLYRTVLSLRQAHPDVAAYTEVAELIRGELVDLIDDPVALAAYYGLPLDPRYLPGAQARPESTGDGSDG